MSEPEKSSYLIKRLFGMFIKQHVNKMAIAASLMIVTALCTGANALLLQPVIDDVFAGNDKHMLILIVGAVVAVAFINGLANYGQNFMMRCIGQKIVIDMQTTLYKHMLGMDLANIGKDNSGKLISRFTNDIHLLRNSTSTVMVGLIKESLTFIALVSVMFYQSVTLSLIVFIAFPIAVVPILRLGKRMRKISTGIQVELGEFTSRLDETFKGIRVIKAYQQEETETAHAGGVLSKLYTLYVKAARVQSAASPIMELLAGIAIGAVIWYGGSQVMAGETTAGKFFSFIGAVLMTYKPLKTISNMNTILQEGMAAATRLFELLDTEPTIIDAPNAVPLIITKAPKINFNHVQFTYQGAELPALNSVDFDIKGGQTVALVGPSGGGKSTIMNLLLRFYDTTGGTICIDDTPIKDITISSLRKSISIVNQDVFLFDGTVAQNIAYGRPEASLEDIKQAATHAAAHDFISQLDNGYDTQVGQSGNRLSGGQRQRIAIARAILKDAPILLLDEATSALDSISEKKIQSALERLMKNRTSIVIAHRLSTVIHADNIIVIKKGKVVEQGTHEQLLKSGKEYQRLYKGLEKQ